MLALIVSVTVTNLEYLCRHCADGTQPVRLPWPVQDAPTFDADYLQDMVEMFGGDPAAAEPPGAQVKLARRNLGLVTPLDESSPCACSSSAVSDLAQY